MKKIIVLICLLLCQLAQAEEMKIYVVEEHNGNNTTISICSERDILEEFKNLKLTKEEKQKIKELKSYGTWSDISIASWILEDRKDYIIRQEFIDTTKKFNVVVFDNSYQDKQD